MQKLLINIINHCKIKACEFQNYSDQKFFGTYSNKTKKSTCRMSILIVDGVEKKAHSGMHDILPTIASSRGFKLLLGRSDRRTTVLFHSTFTSCDLSNFLHVFLLYFY